KPAAGALPAAQGRGRGGGPRRRGGPRARIPRLDIPALVPGCAPDRPAVLWGHLRTRRRPAAGAIRGLALLPRRVELQPAVCRDPPEPPPAAERHRYCRGYAARLLPTFTAVPGGLARPHFPRGVLRRAQWRGIYFWSGADRGAAVVH